VSPGLLTADASRSQSDTPHSVELLWTSDQPDAETSTWQDTTLTTAKHHAPAGFETTIPASERPQTYALDRAATRNCHLNLIYLTNPHHPSRLFFLNCFILNIK